MSFIDPCVCSSGSDDENVSDSEKSTCSNLFDDTPVQECSEEYPNPYLDQLPSCSNEKSSTKDDFPLQYDDLEKKTTSKVPNNRALHWVFTINNYTDENQECIRDLYKVQFQYVVFGRETGENGTPHLQGYFKLVNRLRFSQVQKLFNCNPHLEVAKGTPEQNRAYCTKGNDFEELGELPIPKGSNKSKIKQCLDKVVEGVSVQDICSGELCSTYVLHTDKIKAVASAIRSEQELNRIEQQFKSGLTSLREWQSKALAQIKEKMKKNNDREIIWVFEERGGVGKTWFCDYLKFFYGKKCLLLENKSTTDIAYLFNGERIIVFDFCRSQQNQINWEVIEKIKNGRLISTKYKPVCKIFKQPVVVCFANRKPDVAKMSLDRWTIFEIEGKGLTPRKAQLYLSDI